MLHRDRVAAVPSAPAAVAPTVTKMPPAGELDEETVATTGTGVTATTREGAGTSSLAHQYLMISDTRYLHCSPMH